MIRNRLSNWFINMPKVIFGHLHDLLALAIRVWVGMQFFNSGWMKLSSWENTLFLFREEYHVPLLNPTVAAVVGTAGELCFPVLLFIGLFGRLSALGLFFVNVVAVVSYAQVLLSEGFEAALAQHILWGFALVILAVYGPGRASLDALIVRGLPDRHQPVLLT
ncbi:MAG: DoxX family protein [Gammaproteobacteria bacterium]